MGANPFLSFLEGPFGRQTKCQIFQVWRSGVEIVNSCYGAVVLS